MEKLEKFVSVSIVIFHVCVTTAFAQNRAGTLLQKAALGKVKGSPDRDRQWFDSRDKNRPVFLRRGAGCGTRGN